VAKYHYQYRPSATATIPNAIPNTSVATVLIDRFSFFGLSGQPTLIYRMTVKSLPSKGPQAGAQFGLKASVSDITFIAPLI